MSVRASDLGAPGVPTPAGVAEVSSSEQAENGGLVVRGVDRSFRGRPILKDVSLSVPRGSCVLISGANGVGKTTLVRVICGIITPDRGSVAFDGLDPARDRRSYQRRLGFLAAGDRGLYARLTVRNNLEFWAKIALVPRATRARAIQTALERFELSELAGQRSDRLSMGQRQRVRLAMTFLHAPDLVLLDEPTTSLDAVGGDQVRDAVAELTARGGTVLCCAPTGEKDALPFDAAFRIEDGGLAP